MADFVMKRGDLLPDFVALLYGADNLLVDLTAATNVKLALKYQTGSTTPLLLTMAADPDRLGRCTYAWQPGDTDTPGIFNGEIIVSWGGRAQTFPTEGYFTVQIVDDLESHP